MPPPPPLPIHTLNDLVEKKITHSPTMNKLGINTFAAPHRSAIHPGTMRPKMLAKLRMAKE